MASGPLLLTPGPLTTSEATRRALMHDYGSRDPAFVALVARVRARVAALLDPTGAFTCVPMQGSGTFAVEAMLGTFVPREGGLLVAVNGAYGDRIASLAARIGRRVVRVNHTEIEPVDPGRIAEALAADPDLSHVAMVHCETTTGLLNPVDAVADVVARAGRRMLVDAMSAFGALALTGREPIDAVAASSNKCLEGVPGLGFVLARSAALSGCGGRAHSIALDLYDQWRRLEQDGQFRFTPPTHVLAGLDAALSQHAEEGGVAGRGARYRRNCAVLTAGLDALGFQRLLPDALQAPIIVTVREPADARWDFSRFYDALVARGFAIYPGKLTVAPTFRVGCIGQVHPTDMERFVKVVGETVADLGVTDLRGLNAGEV